MRFRPLVRTDLPLMQRWLTTPHVLEWWGKRVLTLEQVEARYLPRILGKDPTDCYLVVEGDRDIGFIQTYNIADYPEYDALVNVEERANGLDLFIGEPDRIYRGLGPQILRDFMRAVVFVRRDVASCIIGPAMSNSRAIRAYQKAGFTYLKTIVVPDEDEPEILMRIWRWEIMERDGKAESSG